MNAASQHEALRQQLLLRALWRDAEPEALQGWLRQPRDGAAAQGLSTYRANAGAIAERALASAFPTIAALVGNDSFAALARDFWQQQPPVRGDLGEWGADLPGFIAANAALASEPYLADSARLDWLVHLASRAADGPQHAPVLDALDQFPPATLRLTLQPGCTLLASDWPIVSVWRAHQHQGDNRFAAVRAAFDAGMGEHAFVHRDGFAVDVDAIDASAATFTAAVMSGVSLAGALDAAGGNFAFDRWLVQALQQRWLIDVQTIQASTAP